MSICCRTTTVTNLFVNTVSSASVVQFGDGAKADLKSRVIAVQRAIVNNADDAFFQEYSLFYRPKFKLLPNVNVAFNSECSDCGIHVGAVSTIGVSASSFLRVGCGGPLEAETRILNVRQFNDPRHPLIS